MKIKLLTLFLGINSLLFSQPYQGFEKVNSKPPISIEKAASCIAPSTTTFLELNNVSALVHTAGNLWQVPNQNYSHYEVPKKSGIQALFTAALWLGGTDVNGQLKLAALRYRQGQDYWTGPLTKNTATTNYTICKKYDKHFTSTKDEISEFKAWYEAGVLDKKNGTNTQTETFPNYKIPEIVKNWPAHGDISLGQDYYLAPFFDRNDDGNYDWNDGDFPWYDLDKTKNCRSDRRISLYGDLNHWWVMNDKGNIHTETNSEPIGMEIRSQAFSFSSNDEINNMTFYNYELINRGTQTLYNTYFGFFTDGALGNPMDDFVGCDVNRGLGYYYNGNNVDLDVNGFKGYGASPPAVGVDFFEGPFQDNDGKDNAFGIGPNEALNGIGYGDGVVDNERFGMRRFLYYSNTTNGANPNQTDPIKATDYYNYLQGKWKDGSRFVYGGNGHFSDPDANPTMPCDFMFPGDTDPLGWGTNGSPQLPWTEQTAGNLPNDKRFVESAGPFILTPGSVNNITVGVCWARSTEVDPFASVQILKRADDKAQVLFENCFRVLDGPNAPDLTIQELNNELILMISNPVNSNNYNENYSEVDPFIQTAIPNADKKYTFQGYQIYQLSKEDVSVSDLENPSKARLVAQCDIKDNFSRIINFEFDENLQASIPVEKVNGANQGIKHTFKVTDDLFALGTKTLVNFKQYYFMAVAYATNNYKTYNPNDALSLDGQQKVFLLSRKATNGSVKSILAIPHNPMPEINGTNQLVDYGTTPKIKRLDGVGNGGRNIELTEESENEIVASGFLQNPEYDYETGPINIKVVDPLNLADGYFECLFNNYTSTSSNASDTASWTINRYTSEGGVLIDSKTSQINISKVNEQVIPQWGISVQINQVKYKVKSPNKFTEPISSSISYSDSSKRWLSFITDQDSYSPNNWIRLGNSSDTTSSGTPSYYAPFCYNDEAGIDSSKLYAKLLDGGIAPQRIIGYQCDFMPLAYYGFSSGTQSGKTNAQIAYLPSVNIVITSDKSKWTRCPVIELGRDPNLTVGGAKAGGLRKGASVDKNGNTDNSNTSGMGWFPGYAIDIESGARLYMAFGENSFLQSDNGADMKWNPTDKTTDQFGNTVFGGLQPIYIFSYKLKSINNDVNVYDLPYYSEISNPIYDLIKSMELGDNTAKKNLYSSLTWIANTILTPGKEVLANDVKIKLRVNKEYKNFFASGKNDGKPMYSWNMNDIATRTNNIQKLAESLSLINVVPNPYYAYSEYEVNRIDTHVKITNLPEKCTISIYSINGKLVRTYKKDNAATYQDWDLNNFKGIAVAGGVYLIHIDVPGVGERIVKFFGGMRQVDLQNL